MVQKDYQGGITNDYEANCEIIKYLILVFQEQCKEHGIISSQSQLTSQQQKVNEIFDLNKKNSSFLNEMDCLLTLWNSQDKFLIDQFVIKLSHQQYQTNTYQIFINDVLDINNVKYYFSIVYKKQDIMVKSSINRMNHVESQVNQNTTKSSSNQDLMSYKSPVPIKVSQKQLIDDEQVQAIDLQRFTNYQIVFYVLKQIYEEDKNIFYDNQFGISLTYLFKDMDKKNPDIDNKFNQFIQDNKCQTDQQLIGDGDTYRILLQLISKLKSYKDPFFYEKNFIIKRIEGPRCNYCHKYNYNYIENGQFLEVNNELGIESSDIFQLFNQESKFQFEQKKIYCYQCENRFSHSAIKTYSSYPEYLIVRYHGNNFQSESDYQKTYQYDIISNQKKISYRIIGACFQDESNHKFSYLKKSGSMWVNTDEKISYPEFNQISKPYFLIMKNYF